MSAGDAGERHRAVTLDGRDARDRRAVLPDGVTVHRDRAAAADSGMLTVPLVPSGADIVSANELSPSPRLQRDTSAPDGVGTWPCAHSTSPGCGAMTHVL